MRTLENLAARLTEQRTAWLAGKHHGEPATEASVAFIESTLKFKLPRDFIKLSQLAPSYGVWFGSIGDDYDHHDHLLQLNGEFHQPEDGSLALPKQFVLINHGHDQDCVCFDARGGSSLEYPICYIDMSRDSLPEPVFIASTFKDYLEQHIDSLERHT